MLKSFAFFAGLIFCFSQAFLPPASAATEDVPTLHVPQFDEPIVVDGKLSEKCWTQAARVKLSDPWKQTGSTLEPTEVLVLSTREAVYFAFLAQDSEVLATRTERDSETHLDDCAEIFLAQPVESPGECLGLEINALGTVADFYSRPGGWINYSWQPETTIKALRVDSFPLGQFVQGSGFIVEMKIPWKELLYALPAREIPTRLRANFARWDLDAKGRIFSIWSDPHLESPGPYSMGRFGWLDFDQQPTK